MGQLTQSPLKAANIVHLKLVFLSVQYSPSCNPCNWNWLKPVMAADAFVSLQLFVDNLFSRCKDFFWKNLFFFFYFDLTVVTSLCNSIYPELCCVNM